MNKVDKLGLDDFFVKHKEKSEEKLQELIANARSTIELHIEENLPTELLLKETSRLNSLVEKERIRKIISKYRGTVLNAVRKEAKKYEIEEENESKEKKYTAYFPELVDLVEDESGNVVFLIKEGNELLIKSSIGIDNDIYYPPPRDQLPFKLLARANEVLGHHEKDSDSSVYTDLITFHKIVSELPKDEYYELIASWVLHTYLLESFEYSPYVWLYAIPERGKSRTGKGAIYVAYRGVHVESLRDAYLIRIANNLKATIFFDTMDLWKKAEKAGSEDFLLQRYERGAVIIRVLYPERGAFNDSRLFNIFGATFVATNEPVHPALESRAILISMKEASKEFGDIPLDSALSLKERLVAFRARHLGEKLPEIEKPAKGRLGDILKPLMQVILLVAPDRKNSFLKLIQDLDKERKAQKSDSSDARLISIIASIENEVEDGLLAIQKILDSYNEGLDEKFHINSWRLGWRLKALGFTKRRQNKGACVEYDKTLLQRLMIKFGLLENQEEEISTDTDLEKRHKHHERRLTNNDGLINGDVSSDVFQEKQETSQKHHSENTHKYGTSDVCDNRDVFPTGASIEKFTYSTGEIAFKLIEPGEDGKPTIRIINPDTPNYEDIRRRYEQQQSRF